MATRHFSRREEKDSRIKWEKVDSTMVPILLSAINQKSKPSIIGMVFAIIPFSFVAMFIAFYFLILKKENPSLLFSLFYLIVCVILLIIFSLVFIKPFLFPIKKQDIWIFHAKCTDVTFYRPNNNHYFAFFQQGGDHISIRITAHECKNKLPVGKEYIFYKFNNKRGNLWKAITAEMVNDPKGSI